LALAVVEGLLDGDQELVSDVVTHQPTSGRRFPMKQTQGLSGRRLLIPRANGPSGGATHPSSSENLCAKEMMSEARPLPSHTTTGMGGSSLRLSRAMEITLGPPSTKRHTTGTPCPRPGHIHKRDTISHPPHCPSIPLLDTSMHVRSHNSNP